MTLRTALVVAPLSAAGGMVGHGIYFLARETYGFTDAQNLLLAAALFLPYVPAALLAGRVARRLSARGALFVVNLVAIVAGLGLASTPPVWALWILAPLYNASAGMYWPLIEGYVAGGRSDRELHRAIGQFNLTWAATLAPGLWLVGLLGESLLATFGALLAMHVFLGIAAAGLPRSPPPHPHAAGGAGDRRLLRACRVLLPVSYMVLDTLSPLLPGVLARAGATPATAALLGSAWMVARFVAFVGLVRWSGWRGRGSFLVLGALGLLAGFLGALSLAGMPAVVASLVLFGLAHGCLYYAALYYGMSAGDDAVDAGGWHEATVGLGYLAGPAVAFTGLALGASPAAIVGVAALFGGVVAWGRWRTA